MAKLFKISDAASLGLHAMAALAVNDQHRQTVHDIASELNVSVNHLAKVVQRLVKTGLIESERGPSGGIRLARIPSEINFMQVYEAVEGPMDENYCLLGRNMCNPTDCILGGLMESVNNEVKDFFTKTTLDKFVSEVKSKTG